MWYAHKSEKLHSVRFTHKEACQSVCVLAGGDKSHHASSIVVWMSLPNGELAMTDAENSFVFGPYFDRVFNNRRSIDWPVLDKIKQIDMIEELYPPILWEDIKNPPQS